MLFTHVVARAAAFHPNLKPKTRLKMAADDLSAQMSSLIQGGNGRILPPRKVPEFDQPLAEAALYIKEYMEAMPDIQLMVKDDPTLLLEVLIEQLLS